MVKSQRCYRKLIQLERKLFAGGGCLIPGMARANPDIKIYTYSKQEMMVYALPSIFGIIIIKCKNLPDRDQKCSKPARKSVKSR